ncbi:acyltransferase family protein [Microbispora sp. RL4-1S]|uniref:Acyltransferase family protein n=1 Tax=Microbispora oryzae TaxID=2806554 RepID=A0A941AS72_9ACTN|nr:acyltransferase family protein [Microbispora oryzae]MBP2707519.1 acyltransferase family protein [Microbispora oryzae]
MCSALRRVPASTGPTSLLARPAPRSPGRSGREREVWADVAKGACIPLVVLWHVVTKHYLRIDWHAWPVPGAWGALTEQLVPLRMPLFFTVSGMFATGAVNRPWRGLLRSKTARWLYLYAVWLLIHTALLAPAPGFGTARARDLGELLGQLTVTPSNLWYLYALALYFPIAKATRRLPGSLVTAAALALSAATAAGVLETPGDRGGVYANLFFFLAGARFRPLIERLVATATTRRLLLTAAAYGTALAATAVAGARTWPGVWPAVCVLATVFGLTAAARVARVEQVEQVAGVARRPWPARALARLGRTTLPVYVLHMPLLALLDLALTGPLSAVARLSTPPAVRVLVAAGEPVVVTALLVGLCLALHRVLLRAGARWLFDLPRRSHPSSR